MVRTAGDGRHPITAFCLVISEWKTIKPFTEQHFIEPNTHLFDSCFMLYLRTFRTLRTQLNTRKVYHMKSFCKEKFTIWKAQHKNILLHETLNTRRVYNTKSWTQEKLTPRAVSLYLTAGSLLMETALNLSSLPMIISSTSLAFSRVMFVARECWPNPTQQDKMNKAFSEWRYLT